MSLLKNGLDKSCLKLYFSVDSSIKNFITNCRFNSLIIVMEDKTMPQNDSQQSIVSEVLLSKFKSLMKECLNHAEEFLDEKKYKLFKSYIMYSAYHNFRSTAQELVSLNILSKNTCDCRIETKKDRQDKNCVCRGTEFVETKDFIKFSKKTI